MSDVCPTANVTHMDGTPLTVVADGDPVGWATTRAGMLRELASRHGAVRVTGLDIADGAQLAAVRDAIAAVRAEFAEQFAPCRPVGEAVYTSQEWTADREMCLHHEQSQAIRFPGLLLVACVRAPDTGGATLLGDTRRVLRELPTDLVQRFRERGWSLERNFRSELGLSWPTVFGTHDPAEVESSCAGRSIELEWLRDGTLRTVQRRSAVLCHPVADELCWFNDVAFFSQWSVPEPERALMLETFGPHGLPFNTGYGDGQHVDRDEFDAILAAYNRTTVRVAWQPGELLLVDNLLTAHGREPYTGQRELLVALAEPVPRPACETPPA